MKLLILYYSMFGHVHRMAEAIADGARDVPGMEVILRRIPETLPYEVLGKMGATEPKKGFPLYASAHCRSPLHLCRAVTSR
jgi:NAD(P)H dehydrogenase (quinone)